MGTQPGLSGLAVQQSGNLLAVSVAPDNKVYLLDKLSGAFVTKLRIVTAPGRDGWSFSPDGSLWVVSGGNVVWLYQSPRRPGGGGTVRSRVSSKPRWQWR